MPHLRSVAMWWSLDLQRRCTMLFSIFLIYGQPQSLVDCKVFKGESRNLEICNTLLLTVEATENQDKTQHVERRLFSPLNFITHHRKPNFEKLPWILFLQTFAGIKCCLSELVILSFYGHLQCSLRASLLSLFLKVDIEIKWDCGVFLNELLKGS